MKLVALFVSLLALGGCAAMQQDYQNRMCNYDAAYEDGANTARQHGQMNGSMIASNCPIEVRDAVMSGYRAGYASVPQQRPVIQPVAPVVVVQQPAQGYQTYPPRGGQYGGNPTYIPPRGAGAVLPSAPPQPRGVGMIIPTAPVVTEQCLESYGRRVCGYGCKESYGNIRCASNPRHSCIASYGKLYCGLNCREETGRVVCDEWD